MANKERGEFLITIGDRTYTLRLTTNACAELEDVSGGRTWDQVQMGIARGSVKDVRWLFWAAFRAHHPDIATDDPASVKAIGKLIDDAGGFAGLLARVRMFVAINQDEGGSELGVVEGAAPADPPLAQDEKAGAASTLTPA